MVKGKIAQACFRNYSNNELRLKAQNAGTLEYYTTKESLHDLEVLWELEFITALDEFLLSPLNVNKSLKNRIIEFLDHEDRYFNGSFSTNDHYANVLESLDDIFLASTMEKIKWK